MPGRLLNMATNGTDTIKHVANGKGKSPTGAVQPAEDSIKPSLGKQKANDNALINGDNHIPGLGYPTPNGVSPASPTKMTIPESIHDLPEEVMHIATDQHSLGALIQRVSGQCFHSLEALVDELSKQPIPSTPPMMNGASSHNQQPSLSTEDEKRNREKKTKWLNFASDYRAKFIKLLVVTDWAKKDVMSVSKLIDLKTWLVEHDEAALHAGNSFYQLIREHRSFKIPNPDLETALAVLSGGDVPWIPHLGFREQEKLKPDEILKVLKRMNTIINLRLVLHEDLIPQLRHYRVGDGRATFTFPQEFELDVYVASEDPAQPWYFLDVRFLFHPAPPITGDRLRASVDQRINVALAEKGIRGAVELAHDFTLTHKINIFRKQAADLQRGAWANALGVDMVRRTLIVQYWIESPQAKSWIELGIVSGKDKRRRKASDDAISSQIKARWIRNGKVQEDVNVPIDLAELSLEHVVKAHVARHCSWILRGVQETLQARAAAVNVNEEEVLRIKLRTSDTEPSDCTLQARIGDHPPTALQIDPVTGRMYFSPANPATPQAQHALEGLKDPSIEAAPILIRYLTYEIQMRIDRLVDLLGWSPMRHVKFTKEEAQVRMKREVHRYSLFQPRGFGGNRWFIAYAINLSGESWWALEITDPATGTSPATSQLKLPGSTDDNHRVPLTLQALKKLEQSAATAATLIISNRALTAKGVTTSLRQLPVKDSTRSSDTIPNTLPVLTVKLPQLLQSRHKSFANETLSLQCLFFDTDRGQVRVVAKGRMRNPQSVRDILQQTKDPDIAFQLDGAFSVVVEEKIGTSPTSKVINRLETLGKLCNLAKTLREHKFECKEISFSKVCFTYSKDQELTLLFAEKEKRPHIFVQVPSEAPMRRVQDFLEVIINDEEVGFERFTTALEYFQPVLRAFDTLNKKHAVHAPYSPQILPRQVDYYRLTYPNPDQHNKPYAAFDLNFKRNKDEMEWRISDLVSNQAREEREQLVPGCNAKLAGLMRRVGTGWTGMRTLLVADRGGVEDAVLELDRVVWGALVEGRQEVEDNARVKREIITID